MRTVLGCIADDFTGATDLAGLLARSGYPVSLRIGIPDNPPSDPAPFEVIALKCRTSPVDEAVAECRAALDWLRRAGATQFFWKYCSTFDSTPKGNVGPVAEALMADLGATQTIYCPAFPENGRSIFMGNLFVGQQPLHESPMKDHPLTPMRDSNLMRLLEPQVTAPVGLIDRLTVAKGPTAIREGMANLANEGTQHVVIDAVADEDLTTIATACQDMPLLTGGSAVAMPLPNLLARSHDIYSARSNAAQQLIAPPAIVLSGSCSAMTLQQVATFKATAPCYRLDPVLLSEIGSRDALDWLAQVPLDETPILYATAEPDAVAAAQATLGAHSAGALVEDALAEIAKAALTLGRRRFVVAGGETSGAVTQALDVSRLDIGFEIAPGVPWTFAEANGAPIALTLKSGNFGQPEFFADALAKLEHP